MYDHLLRDGGAVKLSIPAIPDSNGKGDYRRHHNTRTSVDDGRSFDHGDQRTISHSFPKKWLRQSDRERFWNHSDGCSAACPMGVPEQGGSLGPSHGGDRNSSGRICAGAVGAGDVDRWNGVDRRIFLARRERNKDEAPKDRGI
jgi:hypothetical protein